MSEKEQASRSTLYPGRKILVGEGEGQTEIKVFPLGVRHMQSVSSMMDTVVEILKEASNQFRISEAAATAANEQGPSREQAVMDLIKKVGPTILEQGSDILADCVEPSIFNELSHWDMASVAEAFFLESFGDEKKRKPWLDLIEGKMAHLADGMDKMVPPSKPKKSTSSLPPQSKD